MPATAASQIASRSVSTTRPSTGTVTNSLVIAPFTEPFTALFTVNAQYAYRRYKNLDERKSH